MPPAEDIDDLLARLPTDINVAWRELAPAWKIPATDGDSCLAASAQQLECYRTDSLSVPLLRQLGRPGILTLHTGNGPPVHAVLTGLDDQTVTLQATTGRYTLRLVSLGRLWRGEFATYWRPPPGYTAGLQGDGAGPAIRQLASQLAQLEGAPALPASAAAPALDAALRAQVRAFQRAQGLDADGQPGPLTFMQIDSATNADAPRLNTNPPSAR